MSELYRPAPPLSKYRPVETYRWWRRRQRTKLGARRRMFWRAHNARYELLFTPPRGDGHENHYGRPRRTSSYRPQSVSGSS